jgi:iron complex outermembrane recepter protein
MKFEFTRPQVAVRLALVCAGAVFASSTTAVAQQAAASQADELALEEIVVTARKREESLQDVPISITAFSADTIEERGIESVYEIAKLTPNLSFNQAYGRVFDRPVIRGMSQVLGDRTVSFVVDGIYIAGNMSADLDDLEQVEILKGPQAASYGRGSLAGVISYRTKRPTRELERKVSLSAGDDGYVETVGRISGPIGETFGFKLGARYYDYDGQYEGVSTDGSKVPLGAERTKRVSGALSGQPTENLDFIVRGFSAQNSDGLYNNIIFQPLNCFDNTAAARGGSFCGRIPTIPQDGRVRVDFADIARQGEPGVEQDTNLFSAEGNWKLGPGTVTALVSWNRQDEDWIVDDYLINPATASTFTSPSGLITSVTNTNFSQVPSATMTVQNPGNITRLITLRTYRSQELRFASDTEGKFSYLFGLYHYDSITSGFNGGPRYNALAATGAMAPLATNTGPVGTLREISQATSPSLVDNEAVFASFSYDPTDRWHLTLEGRYQKDVITTNNTTQQVVGANPLGRGTFCPATLEAEYTSFSPRGTIRFDVTPDINVYVNVARGNKPGDFNTGLCSTNLSLAEAQRLAGIAPLGVKEEKALNYEIGSKMRFFDGRMSLDLAAFLVDWTSQQVTLSQTGLNALTNQGINVSLTLNAGETTVKGLEANWRWKFNENWDATVGYGYTSAKFDKFCDATYAQLFGFTTAAQSGPGCVGAASVATVSVAGFRTANAPASTANVGIGFRQPLNETWTFFARTDSSFQGERYAEVYNHASTGTALRHDVRFGIEREKVTVTAWARNVGNERTPDSVVRFFDPDTANFRRAYQVHYPNGRQFGVTAAFEF